MLASYDPAWDAQSFFDNKTGIALKFGLQVTKAHPTPLTLWLNISGDNGPLKSTAWDLCDKQGAAMCGVDGKVAVPGNYTLSVPHYIAPFPPSPPGFRMPSPCLEAGAAHKRRRRPRG